MLHGNKQKTETLMYFLNRSSVFIKNCIFMTAQTWWFQASTQNGPGPRFLALYSTQRVLWMLHGNKGKLLAKNGNSHVFPEPLIRFH